MKSIEVTRREAELAPLIGIEAVRSEQGIDIIKHEVHVSGSEHCGIHVCSHGDYVCVTGVS